MSQSSLDGTMSRVKSRLKVSNNIFIGLDLVKKKLLAGHNENYPNFMVNNPMALLIPLSFSLSKLCLQRLLYCLRTDCSVFKQRTRMQKSHGRHMWKRVRTKWKKNSTL